jgi:CBS domain-containing protein
MRLSANLLAEIPLSLDNMTAADLMSANPLSIREDATVAEAVRFMTDHAVSGVVVINDAGRSVGVLTQTDILIHNREHMHGKDMPLVPMAEVAENWLDEGAFAGPTFVSEVMTPIIFTVRAIDPARKVVEQMLSLHIHRIFVVDEDDVVIGVVTALDVLRRLV